MPVDKIVLSYSATPTNVTAAALSAAMAAVVLYTSPTADPVLGQLYGLTVNSDSMLIFGGVVTRTIILNMSFQAGVPTAPPFFPIHPQTVDGAAAVFSSSIEDATLVTTSVEESCDPDCADTTVTRPGIGAYTVSISYTDAEGHAGTVSVTLNGRTPVPIVLAPGTLGVAVITTMSITSAGSLGNSMGQITVSVLRAPNDCEPPCPLPGAPGGPPASPQATQDALQLQLGLALAYMPNSYYSYAQQTAATETTLPPVPPCDEPCPGPAIPAPPLPTPGLLIAMLTNFFTSTLSQALAVPITAATPTLTT